MKSIDYLFLVKIIGGWAAAMSVMGFIVFTVTLHQFAAFLVFGILPLFVIGTIVFGIHQIYSDLRWVR